MEPSIHIACLLRLFLSGLCGFCIGFERKNRAKEAGIRTHFIVAAASALMMIVSKYAGFDMENHGDPTRIAAQIVTGIGFLGAGMIFVHNRAISGLTTAAGIWATSGIGMAIGAGLYFEGIVSTLILLLVQTIFRKFSWMRGHNTKQITVTTEYAEDMQQRIEDMLKSHGIIIESVSIKKCGTDNQLVFTMSIEIPHTINEQFVVNLFDGDCLIESHG